MKRIVLVSGLISSAILATFTTIMFPLCVNGRIPLDKSEIIGYTTMVLGFVMVFFGIRTYRETIGGGAITFGKAFQVGILITLIACAFYVLSWEIVYFNFLPDFDEKYSAAVVNRLRAEGASAAAVAKKQQEMADFTKMYANPAINVAFTFLEVFPVGLIVTLISAAILRRKSGPMPAAAAA